MDVVDAFLIFETSFPFRVSSRSDCNEIYTREKENLGFLFVY